MNDKVKNIMVSILFVLVIISMLIICVAKEDTLISVSERRKLEQFPEFTIKSLTNGTFFSKFDTYTTDQFVARETFRKMKVLTERNVFKKLDYNNIYEKDGVLIEQTYPLDEKSILNLVSKINYIKDNYLKDENNVYYTVVPDKNYFESGDNLRLDYDKMQDVLKENLSWAKYINIFDTLDLSCYYYTDSHWKQEKLENTIRKIKNEMGLTTNWNYEEKNVTSFKGVYAGQFPVDSKNDDLKILTNDILENCKVYNHEKGQTSKIYNMEKVSSYDKYDVYLSGATALLEITNPSANTDKELIIFRDSYGSSLTPLLVDSYSKVYVIDTRYISPRILGSYINFSNQDVLFEYSVSVVNNSSSLKN